MCDELSGKVLVKVEKINATGVRRWLESVKRICCILVYHKDGMLATESFNICLALSEDQELSQFKQRLRFYIFNFHFSIYLPLVIRNKYIC